MTMCTDPDYLNSLVDAWATKELAEQYGSLP